MTPRHADACKNFDFAAANPRPSDAVSEHSQEWQPQQDSSALRGPSRNSLHHSRHPESRLESHDDFDFAVEAPQNTPLRTAVPEAPHDFASTNPSIQNYLHESSQWNSQSVNSQPPRRISSSLLNPTPAIGPYKTSPGSDIGSTGTGRNAADSGYLTRSVGSHSSSNDPVGVQDEIPGQLEGFRPVNLTRAMSRRSLTPATETPRSRGSTAQPRDRNGRYPCSQCDVILKCPSDLR